MNLVIMLPKDLSFSVGFYEGSFKRLLLKAEDLEIMYKLNKKDICLWCDGIAEKGSSSTSASGPSINPLTPEIIIAVTP